MASKQYIKRKQQEEHFLELLKIKVTKTAEEFKTKEHPGLRTNKRMRMKLYHALLGENLLW